MKALLEWLREFVEVEQTPAELAEALTLAGLAVERVEEGVLELDLTSNRPDWLSHYGVAREIAAVTARPLRPLAAEPLRGRPAGGAAAPRVRVEIEAPEGCGYYGALELEEVTVTDSPAGIAQRLNRLGHRAINSIADLTNYTLWEMGHPTHAFDAERLRGGEIRVRWARAGETLVTLDEIERKLSEEDLVIADAAGPVALAGAMGGRDSAISGATRRVVIESAWFDPLAVRRTASRHGLHTDASHRFERGADPEAAPLAAALIADRARAYGIGIGAWIEAGGERPPRPAIRLRLAAMERMLGQAVPASEADGILLRLGCEPAGGGDRQPGWRPPSWRPDLTREIDLIEEIARIHGYHRFPARLPAFQGAARPLPEAALRDRVRQQLRGRGFAEAVTISFASEAECRRFAPAAEPVRVVNPLSEEAAILRTSSLPAMLHLLQNNLNHGVAGPKLFEIGKLYGIENGEAWERAVLSLGACAGEGPAAAAFDFAWLKGEVEAVLAGFAVAEPSYTADAPGFLHPGRSARAGSLAIMGQVHPELAIEWKLPAETWLAEIQLAPLHAAGPRPIEYRQPSRFPASERDFSFIFPDAVSWAEMAGGLAVGSIPFLVSVAPAEVFRGSQIGEGRSSVLIRARFQSHERTLREEEVQAGADEVIRRLRGMGGEQR